MLTYLLAGVSLGLSSGLSPGPLFAAVITQTLKYGRREGIKVACSPLITDLPIVIAATCLLASIAAYKQVLGAIAVAGGLFIAYMAYENARACPPDTAVDPAAANSIAKGAAINFLSPHPYVFWLTVGSPLLINGYREGPACAAAFLVSFYASLTGAKILLAYAVGKSRRALTGRTYILVMRMLAVLLLLFAGLLFHEGYRLLF
jgi:Putative threonine efflux protein